MAESVSVTNWPDSGSNERVAYDLTTLIIRHQQGSPFTKQNVLATYAECLRIVRGGNYDASKLT